MIRHLTAAGSGLLMLVLATAPALAGPLEDGRAFLAENAKREGVTELPNGLQYEVLKEGTGVSPEETWEVTVHYRGTLIDGTEFDSSYSRGQPATFRLNQVIEGWTKGVSLMKEGAKWKLYIPPSLGYGNKPVGNIPANSTLVFEVELISVTAPPPPEEVVAELMEFSAPVNGCGEPPAFDPDTADAAAASAFEDAARDWMICNDGFRRDTYELLNDIEKKAASVPEDAFTEEQRTTLRDEFGKGVQAYRDTTEAMQAFGTEAQQKLEPFRDDKPADDSGKQE
jgi:hypothetical protein